MLSRFIALTKQPEVSFSTSGSDLALPVQNIGSNSIFSFFRHVEEAVLSSVRYTL